MQPLGEGFAVALDRAEHDGPRSAAEASEGTLAAGACCVEGAVHRE